MPNLTRNGTMPDSSNVGRPGDQVFQYYTAAYTSGTTQEWLYIPDINEVSVTISFDSAGTANLDMTNSPPTMIQGLVSGTPVITNWSPGAISVTTTINVKGVTAIRLNRTSGTPRITVAC